VTTKGTTTETRRSGFDMNAKGPEPLGFSRVGLGQSYPQHYPHMTEPLGEPLSIRDVAQLIGCSPWTVRQRYLPQGLPHLRSGPAGKLIFFRDQVTRWILQRQQKGGK
jgi:hypothetical protein